MRDSLRAAAPIMGGYLVLGIPCGILGGQAGMSALQIALMSLLFYSGAGQYLIANMLLAGTPVASIIASVSLVNTRQLLYAAALSPYVQGDGKLAVTGFAATVTDESFGINLAHYQAAHSVGVSGESSPDVTPSRWTTRKATLVNVASWLTWCTANLIGVFVGDQLSMPSQLAAFAMTAIFLCLLLCQPRTRGTVVAALGAAVAMLICKAVGLSGPAIVISAVVGIGVAFVVSAPARTGLRDTEGHANSRKDGTEPDANSDKEPAA